jgi:RNA polymerase sigma-70 factor (ECF subfamily)
MRRFAADCEGPVDDAQPLARTVPAVEGDADESDARAAADDPAAFEPIYHRYRLTVYRYARSRTTSDDAALELTAATFERALRAIGRFRPRGAGMAAWLLRIARNAAIDDARRAARHGTTTDHVEGLNADEHAELRLLVAGLPTRQREVIELRYSAGLTAREIGAVLDISEGAAQKHLERALRALREAYGDD